MPRALAALAPFMRLAALLAFGLLGAQAALAQSVALSGVAGTRGALLVVNGGSPRMVATGDTYQGVRVVSAQSDTAVVEVAGKRFTLRMGDSPVSVGGAMSAGSGNRIVLQGDNRGHFMAGGSINGKSVQFMVDTGATAVAIGLSDAERIGIDYKSGQQVRYNTANGIGSGWLVQLESIRINGVEVFGVQAVVMGESSPVVLLGNSFLTRFSMRRDADQMVLERRY